MKNHRISQLVAIASCALAVTANCSSSVAEETAKTIPQSRKTAISSDPVVLDDKLYRLELCGVELCLSARSTGDRVEDAKLLTINYQIPEGGTVSQIELVNFRDKGLLAAAKIKRGDKADFVEFAFWSKSPDQALDGGCSSHKFLTADNGYEILALSTKRGKGVFVVVGKESWMQEAEAQTTEGFLFFDGCPWPCMGGVLSPFKTKSLPIVQPLD